MDRSKRPGYRRCPFQIKSTVNFEKQRLWDKGDGGKNWDWYGWKVNVRDSELHTCTDAHIHTQTYTNTYTLFTIKHYILIIYNYVFSVCFPTILQVSLENIATWKHSIPKEQRTDSQVPFRFHMKTIIGQREIIPLRQNLSKGDILINSVRITGRNVSISRTTSIPVLVNLSFF